MKSVYQFLFYVGKQSQSKIIVPTTIKFSNKMYHCRPSCVKYVNLEDNGKTVVYFISIPDYISITTFTYKQ